MDDGQWVKPWRSTNNGQCVEVKRLALGDVLVRDDKLGEDSPVLRFSSQEWGAFIRSVRDGQYGTDMEPLAWSAASHPVSPHLMATSDIFVNGG